MTVAIMKIIIMTEKKIVAAIETAATIKTVATTKIVFAIKIVAVMATTSKVFRKESIIAIEEKIATVIARTSRRSSPANFNGREKYILINSDVATFV